MNIWISKPLKSLVTSTSHNLILQIAEILHVSPELVTQWYYHKRGAPYSVIKKIAEYYGVRVSEFMMCKVVVRKPWAIREQEPGGSLEGYTTSSEYATVGVEMNMPYKDREGRYVQ